MNNADIGTPSFAHRCEYALLRGIQVVLFHVPLTTLHPIARGLATFVYTVLRYRRNVTLDNLRKAFPEKAEGEISAIARGAFASAATTFLEFLSFPRWTADTFAERWSCQNPQVLRDAYAQGKGVIVLTAHYGSWEVYGQAPGFILGRPGALLAKVQSNRLVNAMVDGWRTQFGNDTIPSNAGIREVMRRLHQGQWIIIAADQSAPRESVPVMFFGRSVSTFQGPATFALRTGAPIVFGAAIRQPDGRYAIRYELIETDGLVGTDDEKATTLTARLTARTEALIRQQPEQWMWMHRRWKHLADPLQSGVDA